MPSLPELQRAFARAIDGDATSAPSFVHDGAIDAAARLGIYANNVRGTFRTALALSYPAVLRIGGETWFAGAAREFRRTSPSRSGDLHPAAAGFPEFLARELAGTPLVALAELARLEWACEEAAVAADASALDLAALAEVPPAEHDTLVLTLHPSCRVVASPHPIVDLWRDEAAGAGSQQAFVHRMGLEVRVRSIDTGTHAFVAALVRRRTLKDAFEAALAADAGFDLGAALTTLAHEGALAGFERSA